MLNIQFSFQFLLFRFIKHEIILVRKSFFFWQFKWKYEKKVIANHLQLEMYLVIQLKSLEWTALSSMRPLVFLHEHCIVSPQIHSKWFQKTSVNWKLQRSNSKLTNNFEIFFYSVTSITVNRLFSVPISIGLVIFLNAFLILVNNKLNCTWHIFDEKKKFFGIENKSSTRWLASWLHWCSFHFNSEYDIFM